jgi:hypothetical protein
MEGRFYSPCWNCNIKGVCNISAKLKKYYAALITPNVPHQTKPNINPHNLEMHQHSNFSDVLNRIATEMRKIVKTFFARYHGIWEVPALIHISLINDARFIA